MTTQTIKNKILPILKREGVTKAAIFGSFARGEANKKSDVDLLVKFEKGKSLLDLINLQYSLEDKVGRKFDVVSYGGINHLLKKIILGEQKIIYEKRKRPRHFSTTHSRKH